VPVVPERGVGTTGRASEGEARFFWAATASPPAGPVVTQPLQRVCNRPAPALVG
jgi:hypothetical protein